MSAKYIRHIPGENNDLPHVSRQHHRDNFTKYTRFWQVPTYMYFEKFSILYTPLWTTRAFKTPNKQTNKRKAKTFLHVMCIVSQSDNALHDFVYHDTLK